MFREESVYRRLFSNMLNGLAYCRVVYEGDKPVDFIYLMVNEAFYRQTGLPDVVGRRATEVTPALNETDADLFEVFGRVVETGKIPPPLTRLPPFAKGGTERLPGH